MARNKPDASSPETQPEPVSPEAAAEVLTETPKPAEAANLAEMVAVKLTHGQYFEGNGVYRQPGDILHLTRGEANSLVENGTAEIVK